LRFGNPGTRRSFLEDATLKGLRAVPEPQDSSQLPQSCEESLAPTFEPRVSKQTLGWKFANAFSVISGLEFANAFSVISCDVAESL